MEPDGGEGGAVGKREQCGDGRGSPSRTRALSLRGRLPATRLMLCPTALTPICSRHTTLSCGENGKLLGTLRDICEKELPSHRAPRAVWALRDARRAPITCSSSGVAVGGDTARVRPARVELCCGSRRQLRTILLLPPTGGGSSAARDCLERDKLTQCGGERSLAGPVYPSGRCSHSVHHAA